MGDTAYSELNPTTEIISQENASQTSLQSKEPPPLVSHSSATIRWHTVDIPEFTLPMPYKEVASEIFLFLFLRWYILM